MIASFVVTEVYPYLEYSDITIEAFVDGHRVFMELTVVSNTISIGDAIEITVGIPLVFKHNDRILEAFHRLNKSELTITVVKKRKT